MAKVSKKKICLISSAGGHLEQIFQLKDILEKYNCFFVTMKTNSTLSIKQKKYFSKDLYRGKNLFIKIYTLICMFIKQFYIFLKERPNVIITTGAGLAIPMCLIGKLFRKKIIYIESFARMNSVNKSGEFIYKFADLFIVQWESLLEYYPNAIYGGWIY